MIQALLALALSAANPISTMCAEEWPNDYQMQEYCINQQTEAAFEVKGIMATYGEQKGTPEYKALGKCVQDWSKGEQYNYQMIAYCFNRQKEAIRNIGAR